MDAELVAFGLRGIATELKECALQSPCTSDPMHGMHGPLRFASIG